MSGTEEKTSNPTYTALRAASMALCLSFANKAPLDQLLSHFTSHSTSPPITLEHGPSSLAPFLGKTFRGTDGIKEYFGYLSDLLSYRDMKFSDCMVDVDTKSVSVKG